MSGAGRAHPWRSRPSRSARRVLRPRPCESEVHASRRSSPDPSRRARTSPSATRERKSRGATSATCGGPRPRPSSKAPSTRRSCSWRDAATPRMREGRRLIGAGRLLNRAIEAAGIERRRAYVTNMVRALEWEAAGQASPPPQAERSRDARACRPWLTEESR